MIKCYSFFLNRFEKIFFGVAIRSGAAHTSNKHKAYRSIFLSLICHLHSRSLRTDNTRTHSHTLAHIHSRTHPYVVSSKRRKELNRETERERERTREREVKNVGEKEIERELKKLLSTKYVTFLRFLQHRIIFKNYREKMLSYI